MPQMANVNGHLINVDNIMHVEPEFDVNNQFTGKIHVDYFGGDQLDVYLENGQSFEQFVECCTGERKSMPLPGTAGWLIGNRKPRRNKFDNTWYKP